MSSAGDEARAQRISKACDTCRKGKVRCGGQKPACTRCVENDLACAYTAPRLHRGPGRGAVPQAGQRMNQRIDNVETMLRDVLDVLRPKGHATNEPRQIVPEDGSHGETVTSSTHAALSGDNSLVRDLPLATDMDGDAEQRMWEPSPVSCPSHTGPLVLPPSPASGSRKRPRLHRASFTAASTSTSSPLPLLSVDAYFRYPTSSSHGAHPRSMPNKDIALHLIHVYFHHIHNQQYGFLHRKTIEDDFRAGKSPLLLLYSICAVAARFSDHPAIQHDPQYEAGENFAAEAMEILMRSLDQPDLTMLQALLLLCLHAAGAGKGAQAWMLGGMAFRMCTALRLDRTGTAEDETSWHDQEMIRRTFWTAFLIDRFSGAGSEAPFTLSAEYATLPLPASEKAFLNHSMADNPRLFDSSSTPNHDLGSFAYKVRLSEIWGRLARYANHADREQDSSTYTILKQQLDEWFSSLPESLRFSNKSLAAAVSDGEAGSLAFMHILYHGAKTFIERPHITDLRNTVSAEVVNEAESTACQNAIKCCEVYSQTTVVYDNLLSTPLTAYFLFSSGVILARESLIPSSSMLRPASNGLAIAMSGLDRMSDHWAPAKRYRMTLQAYHESCQRTIASLTNTGRATTAVASAPLNMLPTMDYGSQLMQAQSHTSQASLHVDAAANERFDAFPWPAFGGDSFLENDGNLFSNGEDWNDPTFNFHGLE